MAMAKGTNTNAPGKGPRRFVEPIRSKEDVEKIKKLLHSQPRNLALFTLGINSNLRSIDLVSLLVGDLEGGVIRITEKKTGKRRKIRLHPAVLNTIQSYLKTRSSTAANSPLFLSSRGVALRSFTVSALVKEWCKSAGISGHFASHTLRKTFGRFKAKHFPIVHITHAFNHATEAQTRDYLDLDEEFQKIYTKHVI